MKSSTDCQTRPTWETAGTPADQPDEGGGGNATEVPENQLLLARGSAETMVISGRLKLQKHKLLQINYSSFKAVFPYC